MQGDLAERASVVAKNFDQLPESRHLPEICAGQIIVREAQ